MHKQNNKESRSYVQGLRPFGKTLPKGIKGILKKNGYNYSEIIGKWNMLVGKEISNWCFPKSIKMSRGDTNGTLLLYIRRGDEINVEYSKKDIIDKINSHFGYKLINEIKLQTLNSDSNKKNKKNIPNLASTKLKKKVSEIKNEKIRNSLSQLLDTIKNEKN
tara:strand:+ start:82 stop:567 length:486 start_codon:yes stop_codon:yes gene_type:complete